MRKIKKAFLFMTLLLFYSNNTFATTTGTYVVENESSIFGKILLFIIAGGLIGLVLFLSYKMDETEASEKRKEKTIKNNLKINEEKKAYFDNKKDEKRDTAVINTINENISEDIYKFDILKKQEDIFENDIEESIIQNEIIDNMETFDETMAFDGLKDFYDDKIDDEKKLEIEEFKDYSKEDVEEFLEEIDEVEDEKNENIEDTEDYIEDVEEEKDIYYNENNESLNEFTMVFNSKLLDIDNIEEDKDEELDDLEKVIAEANIKKFTRNKSQKLPDRKPVVIEEKDENIKRYTRKKENKNQEEKTKKLKKYTRKKAEENKEEKIEIKSKIKETKTTPNKVALKRGRPKKEDKPKRGRPKKETTVKRGRPKKTETAKRGRPKKEETPKRGRPKKTN